MRFVIPTIAMLWGAGIVVHVALSGSGPGNSAYQTGEFVAGAFGLALVVAGFVSFRRRLREGPRS
jgi:hypothetical protein